MKESQIQIQIIDYLSKIAVREDMVYFAPMNEASMMTIVIILSEVLGKKIDLKKLPQWVKTVIARITNHLKRMGFLSGIPDVIIFKDCGSEFETQVICLEVKTPTGKLSKMQKIVHEQLKKVGVSVYVVRSLDEVMEIMGG